MIETIRVLLFFAVIQLSPPGSDYSIGLHELAVNEPIAALNPGAYLSIDVTTNMPQNAGVIAAQEWASKKYPAGSVRAVLHAKGKRPLVLGNFRGATAYSKEKFELVLVPEGRMPVGVDYDGVTLATGVALENVGISWVNSAK